MPFSFATDDDLLPFTGANNSTGGVPEYSEPLGEELCGESVGIAMCECMGGC